MTPFVHFCCLTGSLAALISGCRPRIRGSHQPVDTPIWAILRALWGLLQTRWGAVSGGIGSCSHGDTPCMTARAMRHPPKGPFRRHQRSPDRGLKRASQMGYPGYPLRLIDRILGRRTRITSFSSDGSISATLCCTYPLQEPFQDPIWGLRWRGRWAYRQPHEPISPYMPIEGIPWGLRWGLRWMVLRAQMGPWI